jgi:hypothetical protein
MSQSPVAESLYEPTGGWPRFAVESLLRLQDALERERTAEKFLHGEELEQARPVLSHAIFSLYVDCEHAGVGDDARRFLTGASMRHSGADADEGQILLAV